MEELKGNLRAQLIRARRGWILHLLNYFLRKDTREVSDRHLQSTLRDACKIDASIPEIHADLRYLEERKFAVIVEPSEKSFGMMSAWITADGQNIDLGLTADPGILVPE